VVSSCLPSLWVATVLHIVAINGSRHFSIRDPAQSRTLRWLVDGTTATSDSEHQQRGRHPEPAADVGTFRWQTPSQMPKVQAPSAVTGTWQARSDRAWGAGPAGSGIAGAIAGASRACGSRCCLCQREPIVCRIVEGKKRIAGSGPAVRDRTQTLRTAHRAQSTCRAGPPRRAIPRLVGCARLAPPPLHIGGFGQHGTAPTRAEDPRSADRGRGDAPYLPRGATTFAWAAVTLW
jgi:hypothetical protein